MIGTSGYSYPFWQSKTLADGLYKGRTVQNFYPLGNKDNLIYYASYFNSVEINCTRYSKLTPKTVQNWCKAVVGNPQFRFTIKAPTYITHAKKLCGFTEWWKEFLTAVSILKNNNRLGAILFQFPPTCRLTPEFLNKLESVKTIIPEDYLCAWEFRHPDWFDKSNIGQLSKLFKGNWTQVIVGIPDSHIQDGGDKETKEPDFGKMTAGWHVGIVNPQFIYIRGHGTTGYSCGAYGVERLLKILEYFYPPGANETTKRFGYFNNTDTWCIPETLQLATHQIVEGEYNQVPLEKKIWPAAISDAQILHNLIKPAT